MTLSSGSAQNIGSREQQQDSFGFLEDRSLAVVADGMGGMYNGQEASQAALKAFLENYEARTGEESTPEALLRSHVASNTAVFELAATMRAAGQMGTTLIATVIENDSLHWVSTGDSGIFLFRDGTISQINHEHTYAAELDAQVERGLISREQAAGDPEREALTAFVGMEYLDLIDRSLQPFPLNNGDVVLLASDGLFKTLSFAEMAPVIHGTAQQICDALLARTLGVHKPFQDNITIVAITVGDPPASPVKENLESTARIEVPKIAEDSAKSSKIDTTTSRRLWIAVSLALLAAFFAGVVYTWRNFQNRRPNTAQP